MKKSLVVILVAGILSAACNNKSPEHTEAATTSAAEVPTVRAEPKDAVEVPAPDPAALAGETHVVYDLLANRPLSHTHMADAKGHSVSGDGGSQSFNRYIQGGHAGHWRVGVEVDGRKASALRKARIRHQFTA